MNDKNGIPIKCCNCDSANDNRICYDCDLKMNLCTKPNSFIVSRNALESRIAELESRNPRAKRLTWVELPIGSFGEGRLHADLFGNYSIVLSNNGKYWYSRLFGWINDKPTLDEAKQAVQEWLDNLVAECAEMAKESEVQNG